MKNCHKKPLLFLLLTIVIIFCFTSEGYAESDSGKPPYISFIGDDKIVLEALGQLDPGNSTNELVPVDDLGTGGSGQYNYFYSASNLSTRNCYGYAIGQNALIDPGHYSNISPYSYTNSFAYDYENISLICNAVVNDLVNLGYTNAREVSSSYIPTGNETKIAFRVGYFVSNNAFADYHFMRWNANGYWLHKPGTTAILKYKYLSVSNTWYPEAYVVGTGWLQDTTFTYKGTVKYVVY